MMHTKLLCLNIIIPYIILNLLNINKYYSIFPFPSKISRDFQNSKFQITKFQVPRHSGLGLSGWQITKSQISKPETSKGTNPIFNPQTFLLIPVLAMSSHVAGGQASHIASQPHTTQLVSLMVTQPHSQATTELQSQRPT